MRAQYMEKPLLVKIAVAYQAKCPECGQSFEQKRTDQVFCHPEHKSRFHARRVARAVEGWDKVLKWRRYREKGGLTRMCQIADDHISEDRDRLAAYEKAHKEIDKQRKTKK